MCPVKTEKTDWKKIAPRAVQERDPDKLLAIIEDSMPFWKRAQTNGGPGSTLPGHRIGKRLLFVDDEPNIRLTLWADSSVLIYVASLAVLSSQPSGSLPTYELSALETASIDA